MHIISVGRLADYNRPNNVRLVGETPVRKTIAQLLGSNDVDYTTTIWGWARLIRAQKDVTFIQLNDGSCLNHFQVVATPTEEIAGLSLGCSVEVTGTIKTGLGTQPLELIADRVKVIGSCEEDYPIQQKNKMTFEYLRQYQHLRMRTNTFGAIYRMRSRVEQALRQWMK
eukprot:Ihof_evm3s278 gene=Ihof_evmTU3s278